MFSSLTVTKPEEILSLFSGMFFVVVLFFGVFWCCFFEMEGSSLLTVILWKLL